LRTPDKKINETILCGFKAAYFYNCNRNETILQKKSQFTPLHCERNEYNKTYEFLLVERLAKSQAEAGDFGFGAYHGNPHIDAFSHGRYAAMERPRGGFFSGQVDLHSLYLFEQSDTIR